MTRTRFYRNLISTSSEALTTFTVTVEQTDLLVRAEHSLEWETRESILFHRQQLNRYIDQHPDFVTRLSPWPVGPPPFSNIVAAMVKASQKAVVGPMAAVAGALAESVGRDLLGHSSQVIVENGGDVFLNVSQPLILSVYASQSPLSLKIGLRILPTETPLAVCTSSGTVGHSLSLGVADAVCVIARSGALADAAATAIGNRVKSAKDCQEAARFGKTIPDIQGVLIIAENNMAAWGDVELVRV